MKQGTKMWHLLCAIICLLHAPQLSECLAQSDLNYIGENLNVQFNVINNLNGNNENFNAEVLLHNTGPSVINKDSWEIFFYSLYMIEPDHLPNIAGYEIPQTGLTFYHVNGILFKFSPTANFKSLQPGATLTVSLVIQYWSVSRTDHMPRWYVASQGFLPVMLKSTESDSEFVGSFDTKDKYKRYADDRYHPFSGEDRYARFSSMNHEATPKPIIPTPTEITVENADTLVDNTWKINCLEPFYQKECQLLSDFFKINIQDTVITEKVITVRNQNVAVDEALYTEEAYALTIGSGLIIIEAPDSSGIFYASQSLKSLTKKNGDSFTIKQASIKDAPRFQYRGMHIDVARNFVQKSDLLNLIKVMGMYKLNNLHLHLTDDEGWRIQMEWCPELTSIGARRVHDVNETEGIIPQLGSGPFNDTSGSGFYSKNEYIEILMEAEKNHIRVIPEIDLPGHAHAAIKSNLQYYKRLLSEGENQEVAEDSLISDLQDKSKYLSVQMFTDNTVNPCIPGTYTFIRKVVKELVDLHNGVQNLTVFHLGGDEVVDAWTESEKCRQFLNVTTSFPSSVSDLMEYFIKVASYSVLNATSNNLKLGFWEDGVLGEGDEPYTKPDISDDDVIAYAWQNIWEWGVANRAYKLANAGYKVVLSQATHLYFDMPNEPDPEERGLYWASRFTDSFKTFGFMPDSVYDNVDVKRSGESYTKSELCQTDGACTPLDKPENILGMQGQLFSETVRTKQDLEYMIYPRIIALAERAWHKGAWEATSGAGGNMDLRDKDWSEFAAAVGTKELNRLHDLGIEYRIPLPGIKQMISANETGPTITCEFPGLEIAYREVGADQWRTSVCWSILPLAVNKDYEFKTVSFGRESRTMKATIQMINPPTPQTTTSGYQRVLGLSRLYCIWFSFLSYSLTINMI
nr:uncharacterized protein LOC100177256 [Ciona intestinalis]|eukprot:XP_009858403.2 uncharacterized protein LOC100177256 [Ciona intestinalis]